MPVDAAPVSTRLSPRRRVRAIAGSVLLAVVCLLAFFTVVIPFVLGAQSYTVLTGSMRPALDPGALIGVRPTAIDDVRVGDIVTYQLRSGEPEVVTHRVVGVGFDGDGDRLLTTQGDANNVADAEPVREVQVRGIMVYAMPWLGYVNIWATPAVKSLVVTALGVLAVGWGVLVLIRDFARRRRIAQSAAAVAAIATVSLTLLLGSSPASAAPPPSEQRLQLSADGTTWITGDRLTLLDGSTAIVPGSTLAIALWVRNASPDPARYHVEPQWLPQDERESADISLAASLHASVSPGSTAASSSDAHELAPGAQVRVPLRIRFAEESGNASRQGAAVLQVRVALAQTGTAARPLPPTGGEIPEYTIATGAVLLVVGGLLLLVRRVQRNRRD